jgi:hypothetical protein
MNTNRSNTIINAEYFRNRFRNHDTIVKKIIEDYVIPKTSSRKKRDYREALAQEPPYTRFSDEAEEQKNNAPN